MANGRVGKMGNGTWIPVNSARKSASEKLRIGYIYSAYDTRSITKVKLRNQPGWMLG